MSNKLIVILIVVAALLGISAMLIVNRPGGVSGLGGGAGSGTGATGTLKAGDRLLTLDPASVRSIKVGIEGGTETDLLEAGTKDSRWRLTRMTKKPGATEATATGPTWLLDDSRVRSVLSILASLTADAAAPAGSTVGTGATVVTITSADGRATTIRLAGRTLGGQGMIEITAPDAAPATSTQTRVALVKDQIHSLFTSPGPRGWRDTQLITMPVAQVAKVRIVGAEGGLALARVQTRWGVVEPITAPADPVAVQKLLSIVENMRIGRFYDDGIITAAKAGLETPVARLVLEPEQAAKDAAAAAQTILAPLELTVGGAADPAGKTLYASLDGGQTIVSVDTESLSKIRTRPEEYITGAITAAPAPEIAVMIFEGTAPAVQGPDGSTARPAQPFTLGVRRKLGQWLELTADGKEIAQDPQRVAQIEAMVNFLTQQRASTVTLSEPAAFAPLGTLSLRTAEGDALEDLQLATSGPSAIVVRTGKIYRGFTIIPDLLKGLVGPLEAPLPLGPDGKPVKEMMK